MILVATLCHPAVFSRTWRVSPDMTQAQTTSATDSDGLPSLISARLIVTSETFYASTSLHPSFGHFEFSVYSEQATMLSVSEVSVKTSFSGQCLFAPAVIYRPRSVQTYMQTTTSSVHVLKVPISVTFTVPPGFSASSVDSRTL